MMAVAFAPRLRRLRRMQAAELRFRASAALRRAVDRARASVWAPEWDRASLVLSGPALEDVRQLLGRRDWMGAHVALADYFRQQDRRFIFTAARTAAIAKVARRRGVAESQAAADRVLSGSYDLLGHRDVRADSPPDWHRDPVSGRTAPPLFWDAVPYLDPAYGDHKVTWELNRHQHFLVLARAFHLTGDRRYYLEFVRQFESWMSGNPPLTGTNWASMLELAFRSLSWWWALQFFSSAASERDESPWLVDVLLGLDVQLQHVEHNLSRYFSPNTHLSGEALALYVVACTLPDLGEAARRAAVGRTILVEETARQVNPDGGHAELSTHYHRYSTEFYLLALNVARLTVDPVAPVFEEAARRQAIYMRTLADDRGQLPLLGDDDGGRLFPICPREPYDCRDSLAHASVLLADPSLAVSEIPEETYWFCANTDIPESTRHVTSGWTSRRFESSGYVVSRNDRGDHLVFDCGSHGYLNGGHAHADALSIVLTVENRPLVVDPGTATYTMDPALRDRFRSTAMHNTVVVDGQPQSKPRGAFHWASKTNATCVRWLTRPDLDYAEGRHDGYRDVTHIRRVVALHGVGWLVVDLLRGVARRVNAAAMWHLHPSWQVTRVGDRCVRLRSDDVELGLASTAALEEIHGPQAAFAPVYGRVEPAPCLATSAAGQLPITIATFIAASNEWLPEAIDLHNDRIEVVTSTRRLTVTLHDEAPPSCAFTLPDPRTTSNDQRTTECAE